MPEVLIHHYEVIVYFVENNSHRAACFIGPRKSLFHGIISGTWYASGLMLTSTDHGVCR